ncbi:MAG: hypothetical protein R3A48_03360 [Polyangiales bacterium]
MRAALAAAVLFGCASRPLPRASEPAPSRAPLDEAAARRELTALATSLVGESPAARAAARELGVALEDASGETNLAGEREADDQVRGAELVVCAGGVGALLVTTRCGNAQLVSLRRTDRWRVARRVALIDEARLGACLLSAARAEPAAVMGAAATEILAAWSAEREDGDSERATVFGVFRVDAEGGLVDLTGRVPFGGEDDATGAAREGRWFVDDVLPPPRDVVLEIRPARRGVDGVALTQIERQVWRPSGHRLVRVLAESTPMQPPATSSTRLAPSP